jgi:hypothetical protein
MSARYGGFNHAGYSYNHQASLTTSNQVLALTRDETNAPRSAVIPPFAHLKQINFALDTIAGGASKVTFYLSADAAGDLPITGVEQTSIVFGLATATKGTAIACIDLEHHYQQLAVETLGTVYLVVSLNSGTAKCNTRLMWRA